MPSIDINWMAIIVAAIVNMVVGMVWYSPTLFGKEWSKLIGKKMEDMRAGGGPGYAIALLGALVQAWVLVHFLRYAGDTTFAQGLVSGFWLWLGFIAVALAVGIVFEGRSWRLWKINAGYFLVVMLINGGLLSVWH